MAVQRRQYTPEFKREAVRLITEGGLSVARAAQDLGVCRSLLGKWKQQLADETQKGLRAFPVMVILPMRNWFGCGARMPSCAKSVTF